MANDLVVMANDVGGSCWINHVSGVEIDQGMQGAGQQGRLVIGVDGEEMWADCEKLVELSCEFLTSTALSASS